MILDNGLKIMSIDATDLFKVDAKTNEVVPSGLSSYYDYKDESTGETLHLRNSRMFKMKLNNSMALDELGRLIADRRMTKTATFKVRRKLATDQVVYVTFKYASFRSTLEDDKDDNCSLDYNSIKLYLDNMKQFLNDVACMPSVLGSSTNIANISEVSMQILLMMASVYADENKKWLNIGFQKRFEMFKKILGMQGIKVDSDVEVIYNVAMPVASTEMIANLKALQEMGAISRETIMEKTEYVSDVEVEKKRLSGENVSQDVSQKSDESIENPSDEVENK